MKMKLHYGINLLVVLAFFQTSGCVFTATSGGKTVAFGGSKSGGKTADKVTELAAASSKLRLAGDVEGAERVARDAMARARLVGTPLPIGMAGQALGLALVVMERHDEMLEIVSEVRDAGVEVAALSVEAASDLYSCNFDSAARKYLEIWRLSMGEDLGSTEANLALVDVWEGRFERAVERFEHAAAVYKREGAKKPQSSFAEKYMVLSVAAASARAGRPNRAREVLGARKDLPDLVAESMAAATWAARENKSLFMAYQELVNALLIERAQGNSANVDLLRLKTQEILKLYEDSNSPCRGQIPDLLAVELPSTRSALRPPEEVATTSKAALSSTPLPPSDRDGDGVPDAVDKCADEPEVVNGVDDGDGCPDEAIGYLVGREIRLNEQIPFAFDSDRIEPAGKPILDWLASFIDTHPGFSFVSIEGHTDDQGDAEYNLDLSRRRAAAVVRALTESGVATSRLSAAGYGESRPKLLGTDEASRAANRRVEFLATVTEQVLVNTQPVVHKNGDICCKALPAVTPRTVGSAIASNDQSAPVAGASNQGRSQSIESCWSSTLTVIFFPARFALAKVGGKLQCVDEIDLDGDGNKDIVAKVDFGEEGSQFGKEKMVILLKGKDGTYQKQDRSLKLKNGDMSQTGKVQVLTLAVPPGFGFLIHEGNQYTGADSFKVAWFADNGKVGETESITLGKCEAEDVGEYTNCDKCRRLDQKKLPPVSVEVQGDRKCQRVVVKDFLLVKCKPVARVREFEITGGKLRKPESQCPQATPTASDTLSPEAENVLMSSKDMPRKMRCDKSSSATPPT